MHPALQHLKHRPWPVPAGRWTWRQVWHELLFAHWPAPAAELRRLVPAGLTLQEFDGMSWVGVVPFRMTGVMRRPWPDLPGVSAFPELNVRLYVERDGKPGVWFLSLDAANRLAAWAARRWFYLPYVDARISLDAVGDEYRFHSRRLAAGPPAEFRATYAPISPPQPVQPGTLEHFLVERYCLYAQSRDGTFYRGQIHHAPWPLQVARGTVDADALLAVHGIRVSGAPLLHFARRMDVVLWPFERLG